MTPEDLGTLAKHEVSQKIEEGCEVGRIEDLIRKLSELSPNPDFPYKEPSDLVRIRAERPEGPRRIQLQLSDDELLDKIYGGWLGRCAGCLLGKPIEGQPREKIEQWLRIADAYPLRNYVPPIHQLPKDAPWWLRITDLEGLTRNKGLLLGQIDHMPRDDDIDYTILGLHTLEKHGFDFTTTNVAENWLHLLPYWQVYTAERVAYRNLVNGLVPPETAAHMNPYREWIGALIRADIFGYVTPGLPEYGAELAYRDARLSHVKNGIYGEMFVSAMISAAFATSSIEEIVKIGLSEIPKKSRLAEAARDVLSWSRKCSDWEAAWEKIMAKYGHYNRTHTINNAALVLLGLLYGEVDYEKSITVSVMGGWDTDCNGATTGSILGVILGAEALPDKWIKPLNNRIESFVTGYDNSEIHNLANRTHEISKKRRATN